MPTKRVIVNASVYTLANFIPQVLSLALLPVFTHYLSPSDYAILNYTASISTYLVQFSILGLNVYLLRYYFLCQSETERRELMGSISIFIFLITLLVHGITLAGAPFLIKSFKISIPFSPYFPLSIIGNFFDVFTILPFILFRVREQGTRFFLFSLSKVIVRYSLSIFVLSHLGLGLVGKMWADLVVNGIFFILCLIIIIRESQISFSLKGVREKLSFSIPFFLAALLFLLVENSDRFFLERAVSLTTLGLFSIAATLAGAFSSFVQSLYKAVEPSVYRDYEGDRFFDRFSLLRKYYFLVVLGIAFSACLFVTDIVGLFTGKNFHRAAPMVPLLILAVVFQSISILYDMILMAQKRARAILGIHTFGAALILIMNYLLIPHLGIWGAALAKNVAYLGMAICSAFFAKRILGESGIPQEWKMILLALAFVASILVINCFFASLPLVLLLPLKVGTFVIAATATATMFHIPIAGLLSRISAKTQGSGSN